jgi:hypothetical protein
MGMYASATLFYGYILDLDDLPENEDGEVIEDFDWAEKILKERGMVDPWDSYPNTDGMSYDQQTEIHSKWKLEHDDELDAWYEAKSKVERTIGVEMSTYGHYDEIHYYLVVKGTSQSASPSYPNALDDLWTDSRWVSELDSFLEAYNIELPEDGPCWWLVASYG